MKKRIIIFLLPLAVLSSCYYDSAERLYNDIPCESGEVSYKNVVLPVLNANCYECHSIENAPVSGESIVLEGYNNLTVYLASHEETFISAIEQNGKAKPMPKNNTKLGKCSIQALEDWIAQGKNDN